MNANLSEMDTRLLKLATRKLLDAFSSLQEAAQVCRVKPTNLSQYQSFEKTAFMPIDVIVALERAAGTAPLTKELNRIHEATEQSIGDRSVRDEALDVPVAVGELLAFICEATGDNSPAGARLSENEKRRYFELRHQVEQELRELDEAVEKDGTLKRHAE
ncbi:MAG: hypothetical protein HOH04_09750 [Rhodospirillaceae bacterium]|jgi:hypothetical protein|nr:hypothetical protein [Rhodospirillaceae bacterium]